VKEGEIFSFRAMIEREPSIEKKKGKRRLRGEGNKGRLSPGTQQEGFSLGSSKGKKSASAGEGGELQRGGGPPSSRRHLSRRGLFETKRKNFSPESSWKKRRTS